MLENFAVNPADYSKPLRLYADVDGVLSPFIKNEEALASHSPQQSVMVEKWTSGGYVTGLMDFQWDEFVASKYVEWSKHPLVDFVWLTSWRKNAPQALDPLLGVDSLGYLPWDKKFTDYSQTFKGVAVLEDQKANPSSFIWLDDMANVTHDGEPLFVDWERMNEEFEYGTDDYYNREPVAAIDPSRFITITPDRYEGLLPHEAAQVDNFIKSFVA